MSNLDAVRTAYRRYAPVYDVLFGAVFDAGRRHTCKIVNSMQPKRILEIGVGTGLSLPLYAPGAKVVGVDVSPEMLEMARRRLAADNIGNVTLHEMDAGALSFDTGSFDVVVASYVLSVVPDPRQVLGEMRRLCAPGGSIVICNHTLADGERSYLPRRLTRPLSRWLGWRPDFNLFEQLSALDMTVGQCHRVPPFGLFTVATCTP